MSVQWGDAMKTVVVSEPSLGRVAVVGPVSNPPTDGPDGVLSLGRTRVK
jgi:hypothetical protein